EAAGKTQVEVGEWVGTPSTTISKIENAERNVPLPHLKLMLQLYEVDPAHGETLIQLAQQAKERGWWTDYGQAVPKWFTEYIGLETAAIEVWTYEQEYVPGLLQTRCYTEAMTLTANSVGTSESAENFARVRATRQQRLTSEKAPMALRAVLSEAVLHRKVGGPDVMREQVARLREAASQPNITVQVLPFSAGAHPGMTGPFTMLWFPERSMNMVYVELRGGAVYLERPEDIDLHEAIFERLSALALNEEDTTSLLSEMERGYK
ncbi:MAG TPA: helix-turn-helix transcriptional regulator, partial [Pseudonocardiaceae bacterium]|nr:helix-turn-helix transcriptional regulator [Pseudonocardiaceae bacterium]